MVAAHKSDLKSFRDERVREQAKMDQMLASLIKREIDDEDNDPANRIVDRVVNRIDYTNRESYR